MFIYYIMVIFLIAASTNDGNTEEKRIQVNILENSYPVYKFVAVKRLPKPDDITGVISNRL